jgi:hypothetical protein
VTSLDRCRPALAWSAGAMERVFLGDLFPGIIEFGRVHFRPLFPCGDEVAWIPLGQETLGESGTMF